MKLRISLDVHHFVRYILERFVINSLSESLSNSAGDSYENVTLKEKSRFFKLYRAYSISFNLLNVGNFPLELNSKRLYQSSGKKKKVVV